MKNNTQPALKERIEKALEDFTKGRASMHVPPLDTDVDVVLAECSDRLSGLEAKCAALAAEVYDLKHPGTYLPSKREAPALDAFLAEVRAHDLNAFIRHHSAELDAHIKNGGEQFDEKSVRIRDIIVSARLFREQIRKEAAQ